VVTTPVKANAPVWLDVEINGSDSGLHSCCVMPMATSGPAATNSPRGGYPCEHRTVHRQREDFYPLAALPGLEHRSMRPLKRFLFARRHGCFRRPSSMTRIIRRNSGSLAAGGFLNYDVVAARASGDVQHTRRYSMA